MHHGTVGPFAAREGTFGGREEALVTEKHSHGAGWTYIAALGLFFVALGVMLLSLVDIRRGFLLQRYALKTPWVCLSLYHLGGLGLGSVGLVVAYAYLRSWEARRRLDRARLQVLAKVVLLILAVFLTVDTLFLYRGVAAGRIAKAGRMNIGTLGLDPGQLPGQTELLPLAATPRVGRPFVITVNYCDPAGPIVGGPGRRGASPLFRPLGRSRQGRPVSEPTGRGHVCLAPALLLVLCRPHRRFGL